MTFKEIIENLLRDKLGLAGLFIIIIFIFAALFAGYIAPYPDQGKGASNISATLEAPNSEHILGTDRQGRDILSRIIFGTRTSLVVAFAVTFAAMLIGVALGAIAGYFGGFADDLIMRATDIFLAFPALLLAIALVAAMGPSLENAMIAIVVSWWPWYTRIVRNAVMQVKQLTFVEAANAIGVSDFNILRRHIIPNVMTPVIVQVTVDVGSVILAAASLSFLGLGAQPPTPDLGYMVSEGRTYILNQWWYSTFPGLAILLLVMAFNLVGDSLRDILDPRTSRGG